MRTNLKDIVKGIVENIDKNLSVSSIDSETADDIQTKLYVCNLKWVKVNDLATDDQGRTGQIVEVGENYVVFKKDDPFVWTSKKIILTKEFYFQAGTPLDVDAEWLQKNITSEAKLPLFWLVLPASEDNFRNGQGLERESQIRLYILEQTNMTDYLVDDHYSQVIKYLWEYYDAFFESIKKDKSFANINLDTTRELYRFGSENESGFEQNVIDANLSAIETRFTLPIRKGASCLC